MSEKLTTNGIRTHDRTNQKHTRQNGFNQSSDISKTWHKPKNLLVTLLSWERHL